MGSALVISQPAPRRLAACLAEAAAPFVLGCAKHTSEIVLDGSTWASHENVNRALGLGA
jgi:hypothetical protein